MGEATLITFILLSPIILIYALLRVGKGKKTKPDFGLLFPVNVVGESSYQDTLLGICGGKTTDGHEKEVDAELIPEPDNRYDPNAVAVFIDRSVVGYLSRADAKAYREAHGTDRTERKGIILGGWKRKIAQDEWEEGPFGVRLAVGINQKNAE